MRAKDLQASRPSCAKEGNPIPFRVEAQFSSAPDLVIEAQLLDRLIGTEIATLFEE